MASDKIKQLIASVEDIRSRMITKEDFDQLVGIIKAQQDKIDRLEGHVSVLQNTVALLKKNQVDHEQYQRRQCLRIFGVPSVQGESESQCINVVKSIIKDCDIDVPVTSIDRAHRIGRPSDNKPPAIIVKFSSFTDRTNFYRQRDCIRKKKRYSVTVDLAKERLDLLKEAKQYVAMHRKSDEEFVFADVNCYVTLKRGSVFHKLFSMEDLKRAMPPAS